MTEILPSTAPRPAPLHVKAEPHPAARAAAQRLEATFLAEMLKAAGLCQSSSFAGGIGEEQFASFQRQALADEMVKSGGLGLADAFYQSMLEANHDT